MLTKDLLRIRKINDIIHPQFIKVDDKRLLEFAAELITIYEEQIQSRFASIQEMISPLLTAKKDVKLYKGLNKIILDRCEFSHVASHDFPGIRKEIFETSAKLMKAGNFSSLEEYQERVLAESMVDRMILEGGLYADLPENERLIKFKKTFPRELLERYNVSLVQSLLIHAEKIHLTFEEPEAAKLRNFFKYLKFFRLLASINVDDKKQVNLFDGKVEVIIDGPVSLFENTQKYGLQLACFFPAICLLSKWKIDCTLKINGKLFRLRLDETSGLKSHYHNFSSYVPEEFAMFESLFKSKQSTWNVLNEVSYINMGMQQVIFPDFSFKHSGNGEIIHLELFHRWHSTQLMSRLKQIENDVGLPLIIGIDRALYNNKDVKTYVSQLDWFEEKGFLFRDFPGVDNVVKLLNKWGQSEGGCVQLALEI